MMKVDKREKLKAAGYAIYDTPEFLGLSPEEIAFIDMKISLCNRLKATRKRQRLSQAAMAKLLKTSQSRVAKMESADKSVSVDLVMKSLLMVGASRKEIAKAIGA